MSRSIAVALLLLLACTPAARHAPELDGQIDITTDVWGWPHIRATTLRDASFAEGYAMAKDRMLQLELFRRTATGRLAERFGVISEQLMESDITMRTLGLERVAGQMWQQTPPGRTRDVLEGYAAGVNLHLAELRAGEARIPNGAELMLDGNTRDWTPVDSLAVLRLMELFLNFNADAEIARTELRDQVGPERFAELVRFAPPSTAVTVPGFYAAASPVPLQTPEPLRASTAALAALRRVLPPQNRLAVGTNAWAVAGSHTASGHALLANDPHLPLTTPGMLWGVHLTVTAGPDALDVTGTAFPGVPGVVFGHNARVAWGICNAMFDQMDVYQETLTANGDAVIFQGREVPLEKRIERIPNGVFGELEVEVAVVPHHGPLLPGSRKDGHALSVRWVALEPTNEVDGLIALMFARDNAEAELAVHPISAPGMAFVFADTKGEVAFRATGRIPVRPRGVQAAFVLPGSGEAEWVGFLDAAALPSLHNAPRIVAANNDPAGLSRDGNPFDEEVYLGYDWSEGFRAERIAQRLEALGTGATREDMESIQADHVVLVAKRFMPFMLKAIDDEGLATRMRAWTFESGVDSVEASVFHTWLARAVDLAFTEATSPKERMISLLASLEQGTWRDDAVLSRAMREALAELTETFGTSDVAQWRWGRLHTLTLKSVLPHYSLGAFTDLSRGPFERPGGIETIDQGWPALTPGDLTFGQGAARRLTIEVTPEGPIAFDALPGGDELDLWRENRSHALPFTREQIANAARSQLTLLPDR